MQQANIEGNFFTSSLVEFNIAGSYVLFKEKKRTVKLILEQSNEDSSAPL
jgi:hypothetical protein